jgi:hypothetical protein
MSGLTMKDRLSLGPWRTPLGINPSIALDIIAGSPAFIIDNVAQYWNKLCAGGFVSFDRFAIALRLPANPMWVEYAPNEASPEFSRVGMLLVQEQSEQFAARRPDTMSRLVKAGPVDSVITVAAFVAENADGYEFFGLTEVIGVDSSGSATLSIAQFIGASIEAALCTRNTLEPLHLEDLSAPALLAVSLANCRNTKRIEHAPRPKLSKRCEAVYGKPAVKYYTLEIDPIKRILETEGRIGEVGLQRALHLCRGHFADYRNGNGLFGKHKGLFWVGPHLRGSAKQGVVIKNYEIKAP